MEGLVIRIQSTLKLIGIAAVAAVLAACSGTATSPTLPTSGDKTPQMTVPRSVMGVNGEVMTFMYTKQTELAGLVTSGAPLGGMHTMAKSGGSSGMTYHGGPVQTAPKLYMVEWGNWGSTGDPDGVASYYSSFVNGIGGSQWLGTQTQYGEPAAPYLGNCCNIYAGVWNDTSSIPSLTSSSTYQSRLAAEAQKAAGHFGDYTSNASYVIMLPHGVQVYNFAGNSNSLRAYCAWHSYTTANGSTIAYTNLPYMPDAGASCGVGSVNSPGTLDGVSIVGGHEQAETETDPQLNAWYEGSSSETGDLCAWKNLQNTSFSTGTFPTQPLWSNSANACVQ
jgi:serine protease